MEQLITRFSYEHLRNEAHVQLHENFIALATRSNVEELGIKSLYDQYLPLFEKEKSVLDVIHKSGLTDGILAQDARRDQLFRGFTNAVKSALNHYDIGKSRAAANVNFILTRYGNIAARPLDEETAAIDDLNRELLEPQNAGLLTTLELKEWLTHLVNANRSFDQMMMNRYSEVSKRPNINMRGARIAVDKLFRAMLDLLEALVLVNGADKYTAFIAELNAIMQRYEHILAQEKGMRAKGEKDEGAKE